MEGVVNIVDALTSIYSWQGKKEQDELMGYLTKYLYFPQCQNFIVNNARNLRNGNTEELRQIYQALMQGGEVDLAKKVENLLSGEFTISEELYTALESYVKSDTFYKEVENALIDF